MNQPLALSGLVPFSATDYPGQLSAVLFCQGCPLRCGYCHNPHLQEFRSGEISWADAEAFLRKRRNLLDAIVFSGGEAIAQNGLRDAMLFAKDIGYRIGLHTSGYSCERLAKVIDIVDWIGLDFKHPDDALDSVRMVLANRVDYEIRTTFHSSFMSEDDLVRLASILRAEGVENFALQKLSDKSTTITSQTVGRLRDLFPKLIVRN